MLHTNGSILNDFLNSFTQNLRNCCAYETSYHTEFVHDCCSYFSRARPTKVGLECSSHVGKFIVKYGESLVRRYHSDPLPAGLPIYATTTK